jgi:heme oxygenase (biliverdin-IX-beta and delta-forming)
MASGVHNPRPRDAKDDMSLTERLKLETRSEHDAIEAIVEALRPFDDEACYARFLSSALGFYEPVEADLIAAGTIEPARAKTPWIVRDLEVMGARIDGPRASFRPPADPAGRFGCAYVLEGATLGGRILLARVNESLGLSSEAGARFLAGYGSETGAMWTSFRAALVERVPASAGDALVEGARETFRSYGKWLRTNALIQVDRDPGK